MKEFWQTLLNQLQNNHKVFIALVAYHTQGSPGTKGAKLWVSETGETFGSIGGGIMEHKLVDRAKEILIQEDFTPEIQTLYHRASAYGEQSGLICSGSQTNLYYLCHPSKETEIIEKVVSLIERDISGTLSIDSSGMSVTEKAVDLGQPAIELIQESGRWRYEERLLNTEEVAQTTGYSVQWIRELARRYNRSGIEGLGDRRENNPGGKTLLDEVQAAQLLQVIQQPAPDGGLWNGRKVADWMSELLERQVSPQRGWEYLKAMEYRLRMPRPENQQADKLEQEDWKKNCQGS